VVWHFGVHRFYDGHIIDKLARLLEDFTNPVSRFTPLCELEWRLHQPACQSFRSEISRGYGLTMVLCQFRFVVECIHVCWPTIHEKVDDTFRLGFMVGWLGSKNIIDTDRSGSRRNFFI
jgi:hypothetical protein